MKNSKIAIAMSIVAAISLTSAAHANKKSDMMKKRYAMMDTNSDTSISLKEYTAYQAKNGKKNAKNVTRNFKKLAGNDMLISFEEFQSNTKEKAKKASSKKARIKMASNDKKQEWAQKRFTSIDTNSDEVIDLEEYTVLRSKNKNLKKRAIERQFDKASGDDSRIDFDEFKATLKGKKGGKKK